MAWKAGGLKHFLGSLPKHYCVHGEVWATNTFRVWWPGRPVAWKAGGLKHFLGLFQKRYCIHGEVWVMPIGDSCTITLGFGGLEGRWPDRGFNFHLIHFNLRFLFFIFFLPL